MQEEYQEKYATISIKGLEGKVENELFPAAFSICDRIEEEGKKEFKKRLNRFISTKCPLRRCAVLENELSKCPNPLCWIAEGPTWPEFLMPEINAVYFLLMDTYIEALDVPENPDGKITFREKPLNVMNRKLCDKAFEDTLSSFYKRKKDSEESPRNLILHGRSVDYGREYKLSAVLFLILVYLIAFSQMKIQGRITIE